MSNMNKKIFIVIILSGFLLTVFGIFFLTRQTPAPQDSEPTPLPSPLGVANPASTYCEENEGNLTIQTREDGGEFGVCTFANGSACEEWAYMRGECAPSDVPIASFETEDQRFCILLGGVLEIGHNAACRLPDGTECETRELYAGRCPASP